MASIALSLLFFFSSSFIDTSHCVSPQPKSGIGFTSRIIHRDSPLSPFYNPNATISDRAKAALSRSDARIHYLESLQSVNRPRSFIGGTLTPGAGEYLMKFSIGTPPQPMMGIIDTGSDLPWFQCLPCADCFRMRLPPLDPQRSQTYQRVGCGDCGKVYGTKCDGAGQFCEYEIKYVDGSKTTGDLSKETFVFQSSFERDRRAIPVDGIVFGCGHINNLVATYEETGVIGLNRERYSLVSQANATSFSYCLGPASDPEDSYLMVGSDAIILGVTTPLVTLKNREMFYYVNLEGISVGDVRLPIPDGTFKATPEGRGGVMIDTGAHFTYMPQIAIGAVVAEIRNHVRKLWETQAGGRYQLCYLSPTIVGLEEVPNVTFHFTNANVVLTKEGTFFQVNDGTWCLAILRGGSHATIGNNAIQGYNVGYDLQAGMISFSLVSHCASID